jgi:purine nucleosidase
MTFPQLGDTVRHSRLTPPAGPVRMVLDTDTFNEIDDQFAVVYALLSKEKLNVEAIHAAPFHNSRSTGPADGMEKSREEILRLLERLGVNPDGLVYRGAAAWQPDAATPVESEAAENLIRRAMSTGDSPLYVAAIGAITNVAAAILMEPEIIRRIIVVWLGGHPLHHPTAREFNLHQDLHASRLIFDSGVPLIHIPCQGVASHLLTSIPEIDACVRDHGAIGAYLADSFAAYTDAPFAWAKEIWDIAAIAWLINADWVPTMPVPSPILTDQFTWSADPARHTIRQATFIHRNPVFYDLFSKLAAAAKKG